MARRRGPTKKELALLPQLRDRVVVLGMSMAEACDQVGISRTTGAAWRRDDEAASEQDWDQLARERMGRNPFDLIRILDDRLGELVHGEAANLDNRYFDQMVGMCMDNIERLKARLGDTTRTLEVLRVLSSWAARRYRDDPERFEVLATSIIECMDDLSAGRYGVGESA